MSPADYFDNNDLKRITMGVSTNYDMGLLSIQPTTYQKIAEKWQAKTARVKDSGVTYRFLNYLSTTGVFPETRENTNKGWRKLSYVDCFLITLISKLRKFGINTNTIKLLSKIFSQPIPPKYAQYNSNIWLDIMIALHCGIDIQLFIDENCNIAFYDSVYAELHNSEFTNGTLRINLLKPLNELRKNNGLEQIKLKEINYEVDSKSETSASKLTAFLDEEIPNMNSSSTIMIRKKPSGKFIVERTSERKNNKRLNDILSSMVEEDFGSINAQMEGGKVVSIQTSSKRQF